MHRISRFIAGMLHFHLHVMVLRRARACVEAAHPHIEVQLSLLHLLQGSRVAPDTAVR